jgi:hypothetical protein
VAVSGRIFDHLDGSPADEDRHFSRVARKMRSRYDWAYPPEDWKHPWRGDPAPVAGEIEVRPP